MIGKKKEDINIKEFNDAIRGLFDLILSEVKRGREEYLDSFVSDNAIKQIKPETLISMGCLHNLNSQCRVGLQSYMLQGVNAIPTSSIQCFQTGAYILVEGKCIRVYPYPGNELKSVKESREASRVIRPMLKEDFPNSIRGIVLNKNGGERHLAVYGQQFCHILEFEMYYGKSNSSHSGIINHHQIIAEFQARGL